MLDRIPTRWRTAFAFAHDVVAVALAWIAAFWFRFNLEFPALYMHAMLISLPAVVGIQSFIFLSFGLYRGIWRYASLPDLKRIVTAVAIAATAAPTFLWLTHMSADVPRSVLLLDPIFLILIMGGSRLAYRAWKEHRLHGLIANQGKPVLLLGAGDAAVSLLKDLARSQEWRPVGLIDDNPNKHGRYLHGVKVLGGFDSVTRYAQQFGVEHAIIAMPSAAPQERRRAVDICAAAKMSVLTVPAFDDLMSGRVLVSQIRKVEVEDLLGREPVVLDSAGLQELISGQVIMVTGAGGSIGSELCRQLARFKPRRLVLFELSEFALYRIEQALQEGYPHVRVACVIGDAKDAARVDQVLAQYQPSAIFHAAAYKHVPLMEHGNAWESLRNNVYGTYILGQAAIRHRVKKFVFISTDKAVNPTNVMGASKRCAEMVCQALEQSQGTHFVTVRFGNVLGSAGSVIPKFQEQIARGGPVTVTHPDIIRYFMSIPEAAQLVLQAGVMGRGGELFVLDMGEPVKIVDLARDMIRFSGFSEDEIKIVFTGLRAGEKLFEELLTDEEHTLRTPHPKLRIAKARPADVEWLRSLHVWLDAASVRDEAEVKNKLAEWLPEYAPADCVLNAALSH